MDKLDEKIFRSRLRLLKNKYHDFRLDYMKSLEDWIFYMDNFPDTQLCKHFEKRTEFLLLSFSRAYREYINYRKEHYKELIELSELEAFR